MVVVVVVVVTEMTPSEGGHFGSEADGFPGHVQGIGRGPVMVLGPLGVANSAPVRPHGALEGVTHEGEGERVAKRRRAETERGRERGGMERGMVGGGRRRRERRVEVLSSAASAALAHNQRQRLRLVVRRRHAAQSATQASEGIHRARDDDIAEAVQPLVGGVVVRSGTAAAVQSEGQGAAAEPRGRGEGGERPERRRTGRG